MTHMNEELLFLLLSVNQDSAPLSPKPARPPFIDPVV